MQGWKRSSLYLLATACIITAACVPVFSSVQPTSAPMNPALANYLSGVSDITRVMSIEDPYGLIPTGVVPEPVYIPATTEVARPFFDTRLMGLQTTTTSSFPASYDLRTQNKLSAIRDQGSSGSCWAFASIGSLESFLMPGQAWDFSENNLKNTSGYDIGPNNGGNRTMSAAYLARWSGPIAESDDPYNPSSTTSPSGLSPKLHVQDIAYIPDRTSLSDCDSIKDGIMTFGAMYTTMCYLPSCFNSATNAYYLNTHYCCNHAVCLVGWDDNYNKSNFLVTPPGNGAFIARNSWGTYWGQSGYFYISYYDLLIGYSNACFTAESVTNYAGIYQYDPLGFTGCIGYLSPTAWFANVFTANSTENIKAVSWYTAKPGSPYELYVYVNPSTGPVGGTPAYSSSGTIQYAGYHTIKLNTAVPVVAGQKFSVAVKLTTPNWNYPVPLNNVVVGYSSKVTSAPNRCFMSSDGVSWRDEGSYDNANICVKAFTDKQSPVTPPSPSLVVTPTTNIASSGLKGGTFSPASYVYSLRNTSNTAINWTASKTQSWITLSSTGGKLNAGASANVTVSINTAAKTLNAGSYFDIINFKNTTNGSGNTAVTASLTVIAPGQMSIPSTSALTSTGPVGGPFTPSSITYTVTNTGGQAISWSAKTTKSYFSLSATSGTLNPGASTNVTVNIVAGANSLKVATYTDTLTFTNNTNKLGNTTRAISLRVTNPPKK